MIHPARSDNHSCDLAYDRDHIWHPYTSMAHPLPVYPVVKACGHRLHLADGRQLIDGMASWWAAIHGYNVAQLNHAISDQLNAFAHVMFGGLTHPCAIELAKQLVAMTPAPLNHVFFSDSGSVAVEVAIKMAIQFFQAQGLGRKHQLLTVRQGYHGDTFATMSVCDPVTGMHEKFKGVLHQHYFAQAPGPGFDDPWDDQYIKDFNQLISTHHGTLAAVILEPIVQGAGGMRFYSPVYLQRVRQLCDDYQVLLICDEIATGFGRTGRLFAVEHAGICPDILCLGKALTGGYMSLAATLTTPKVCQGIAADGAGTLMHGPTFMANALACRVALASTNLLLDSPWQSRVNAIELRLTQNLAQCTDNPIVKAVRVLGAIGVVELKHPVNMPVIMEKWIEASVWIRPFGRLVYIMPAFNMPLEDIDRLCQAIVSVLKCGTDILSA